MNYNVPITTDKTPPVLFAIDVKFMDVEFSKSIINRLSSSADNECLILGKKQVFSMLELAPTFKIVLVPPTSEKIVATNAQMLETLIVKYITDNSDKQFNYMLLGELDEKEQAVNVRMFPFVNSA